MTLSARSFSHLVDCVIEVESSWNPNAVSSAGAQGLMQLMPATGKEQAVYAGMDSFQPFDALANRYVGSFYLSEILLRFQTLPLALAAYNWGMGNVSRLLNDLREADPLSSGTPDAFDAIRDKLPHETREYVSKVLFLFKRVV